MSPGASEIATFRPRRRLFGYDRRSTDEFLAHVAELLEQASTRLAQVEVELAEKRKSEGSLSEALMAAAKTADAIKVDARREADSIRAEVRELDEFVAETRSHLSSFLRDALERLERVSDEIETAHDRVEQFGEEEQVGEFVTAEERTLSPEDHPDDAPSEAPDSVLERLRAYHADTSGSSRAPES